jgi:phosphoglycerate dehydrogenase-like enzyme
MLYCLNKTGVRMTNIGVLIHQPLAQQLFSPNDRERLHQLGSVRWHSGTEPATVAQAKDLLADCDIAVGSWKTPHPGSEGLLAACPRLRLWEHVAGSVKWFFNPEVEKRSLVIASCKGAIGDAVAEYVLGQIIVGLRQMIPNAQANQAGPAGKPTGMKVLAGSTVGVVGASVVGKEMIRLLNLMQAHVRLYDPFCSTAQAAQLGAKKYDDLLAMMHGLDALTIHTPLIDATRRQIHGAHFQALPDDCLVINAARGACIAEDDLINELQKGRLHAFLDVSAPEPAAPDSPLRSLPNVTYTSHIAGPATRAMGTLAVDDISAFLRGDSPRDVVTADMLAHTA